MLALSSSTEESYSSPCHQMRGPQLSGASSQFNGMHSDASSESGGALSDLESLSILSSADPSQRGEIAHGLADEDTCGSGALSEEEASIVDAVITQFGAVPIEDGSAEGIDRFVRSRIEHDGLEETFYVIDLAVVHRRLTTWQRFLPRVTPFYAVKCNPCGAMLAVLAAGGAGFDCASAREMSLVQATLGAGAALKERAIFANPCKMPSHITHALRVGCDMTTFDTEGELKKVKKLHPNMRLLLRIRADDPNARCHLGNKYGANVEDAEGLLRVAKGLGLRVVGVSFHVGSGASDPKAFRLGITLARRVFDIGNEMGHRMTLLDIGGGFSAGSDADGASALAPVASAINGLLDELFPEDGEVRIIAEPGRYFAEASATLATVIYGKRVVKGPEGSEEKAEVDYWITDGLYGSMNCVLYDHATLSARPLRMISEEVGAKVAKGTVFGPTCDGLDKVLSGVELPELECGDWLVFPAMGAYTMAAGSDFNGFNCTNVKTYFVWSVA